MKIVPVPLTMIVSSLIAGHAGAAGRARAHHRGDLRDRLPPRAAPGCRRSARSGRGREDLVLQRQERAARVDEVDARQPVLLGDLLRAQVLLDRQREVRAALDRRVVGDEHALAALDRPDPGDDPCAGSLSVVDAPRRRAPRARGTPCPGRAAGRRAPEPSACRASGASRAPSRRRRGRPAPFARAARPTERLHPSAALVEGIRRLDLRAQHRHRVNSKAGVVPGTRGEWECPARARGRRRQLPELAADDAGAVQALSSQKRPTIERGQLIDRGGAPDGRPSERGGHRCRGRG